MPNNVDDALEALEDLRQYASNRVMRSYDENDVDERWEKISSALRRLDKIYTVEQRVEEVGEELAAFDEEEWAEVGRRLSTILQDPDLMLDQVRDAVDACGGVDGGVDSEAQDASESFQS